MKKKILSVVLGASLGFGIAATFAQSTQDPPPKTEKKKQKTGKTKRPPESEPKK